MSSAHAPGDPSRAALAGALAAGIFAVVMATQIVRRSSLTMDELHTLMLARSWAAGDVLSFHVGSISRYEGGSWFIAWPVSWLLRLGASGTAATSWAAGLISLATVGLTGAWVARVRRDVVLGASVGLLAAGVPELVHFSYRAWGSVCEALIGLPLLAFAWERWIAGGRHLGRAPLLGILLTACILLSYLHMLTAVAFVIATLLERRALRRRLAEIAVVGGTSLATWGLWIATMLGPDPQAALAVRDGRPLTSLVSELLLPDLLAVVDGLPAAWIGQFLAVSPLRVAAGIAWFLLAVGGAGAAWRSGEPRRRWLVVLALVWIPGLSVGHALIEAPEVFRYHLPFLAVALVLIATWDRRAVVAAALCSATLWLPSGLEMPYQNPFRNHLELGGTALYRDHEQPHIKFMAFREHVPVWHRPWFAFGYGADMGQRFSRVQAGMHATLAGVPDPLAVADADPHFSLYRVEPWIDFWDAIDGDRADRAEYLLGLGVGFGRDGRLTPREVDLLDAADPDARGQILEGFGAVLERGLRAYPPMDLADWDDAVAARLEPDDYGAVGRGLAKVAGLGAPDAARLGVDPSSPEGQAMARGLEAEVDPKRRGMLGIALIPTPERTSLPPEGERAL